MAQQSRAWRAILIVLAVVGVASADDPSEALIQGLRSSSCEARQSAIGAYLRSADNKTGQNAGLRGTTISDPEMRARVGSLLQTIADSRDGVARMTSLAEEISKGGDLPPNAQGPRLRDDRNQLLKLVRDRKETLTARIGVPFLLTRLLRAGSDENPDWIPQWQAELEAMLRSSDDALRAVAAVNAAIGRFPEGSDPRTYDVAQALIQGLRSSSSEVRAASDTGLAQITTSGPCFEPSDPPSLRGAAVREWDAWLAQNKASLEAQRIKQNFW